MRSRLFYFSLIICLTFWLCAQKYYEYDNPDAKRISSTDFNLLLSKTWVADSLVLISKDNRTSSIISRAGSRLTYESNGKYHYGSHAGEWQILKKRYIQHDLTTLNSPHQMTLGGIYIITELSDSTLILSKSVTSSHDTKRVMKFVSMDSWLKRPSKEERFSSESKEEKN